MHEKGVVGIYLRLLNVCTLKVLMGPKRLSFCLLSCFLTNGEDAGIPTFVVVWNLDRCVKFRGIKNLSSSGVGTQI